MKTIPPVMDMLLQMLLQLCRHTNMFATLLQTVLAALACVNCFLMSPTTTIKPEDLQVGRIISIPILLTCVAFNK